MTWHNNEIYRCYNNGCNDKLRKGEKQQPRRRRQLFDSTMLFLLLIAILTMILVALPSNICVLAFPVGRNPFVPQHGAIIYSNPSSVSSIHRWATVESSSASTPITSSEQSVSSLKEKVLQAITEVADEAKQYTKMYDLHDANSVFYSLFAAIQRTPVPLGLYGTPFVLRSREIRMATNSTTKLVRNFFTMKDLEKALEDDFLDASRGSTDNRKGWQITDVSQPRGESFEEARMTYEDVKLALEKGTVIFNAAGAHIPKLAQPSLSCTDATMLPCALNLYITDSGKRTSAPPHTDKQDVMVVQTSGRKNWKVYSVPEPSLKPSADIFARGKMEDSLPLYSLESDLNCQLLIDTTLYPGDVLFCPAGCPHTTSTVAVNNNNDESSNNHDNNHIDDADDVTSIHLTLGIDHHIWELDYLSARRLALRRAGVHDTALGQTLDDDNRYVGKANELPSDVRNDLFAELPLGLLNDDDEISDAMVTDVAIKLLRISEAIDTETASRVDSSIWKETIERVRIQGKELFDIHRDMYLAAIDEGRKREAEDAMTAHISTGPRKAMSPKRIQRLSLFRVKTFYERIDKSKRDLKEWSYSGRRQSSSSSSSASDGNDALSTETLPPNWAYVMPVSVGDQVEADLGGALFPATVSRASGGTYDVTYFDGDKEVGLDRSMIKLLNVPKLHSSVDSDGVDTSQMTPKQIKRWKKEQENLKKR